MPHLTPIPHLPKDYAPPHTHPSPPQGLRPTSHPPLTEPETTPHLPKDYAPPHTHPSPPQGLHPSSHPPLTSSRTTPHLTSTGPRKVPASLLLTPLVCTQASLYCHMTSITHVTSNLNVSLVSAYNSETPRGCSMVHTSCTYI